MSPSIWRGYTIEYHMSIVIHLILITHIMVIKMMTMINHYHALLDNFRRKMMPIAPIQGLLFSPTLVTHMIILGNLILSFQLYVLSIQAELLI